MRIVIDEQVTEADGAALWPVYDAVFGDQPGYDAWREAVWDRHRARPGFRLVRAYDGDELVGFAYGYAGADGQWFTDNARKVLPPGWLGGHFELVSIGVLERRRGRGIGRELLRAVSPAGGRQLLMTSEDAADPARRLYASEGWRVVGPGLRDGTVIMGKGGPA